MKKINFKEKKYVLPIFGLTVPFSFRVMSDRSLSQEDTSEKDKPKELLLSLGDTQDSIMTKNDAYDAFFKKEDNRTMLGGLDKEKDSLLKL